MILFRDVSKKYDSLTALAPTDLEIESGKTTALIGSSGCGKSTVLRLIVGLIEPTTGTIEIDGHSVTPAAILDIRRRIGYVIQDGGLFPHLTAEENAGLMWRYLKRPRTEMRLRLEELCDLTRFPVGGLARYPAELSGGQRQRVSLMRALMLDPQVLLLDEPLGALDPLVRAGLQTDLKTIFQQLGKTVVLVTHDMAEAGYLADAIVLMREGRIIQKGTLGDLRDRPADAFVSEFISAQRSLVAI
ncbi:MAG: ATP-binding cassette domain-containing protein [Acidobacteria bacterium]|nr:ATP-binding cassette domain-containing protein [Acidobacteriota bacterium]